MHLHTLTIVGVGLIGGSIGLAAKRRGVAQRVVAVGHQPASLQRARALQAFDDSTLDLRAGVRDADLVVLCTPVDQIAGQVLQTAAACAAGTVLTDAGSAKAQIVRDVEARTTGRVLFVGSHPLAGSEKRGVEHADADLFEGRVTVVTPTPRTDPAAVERVCGFWQALGARVRIMSPEEHDRAVALTSHVPHLVAAALAGTLPDELRELAATGFRDTTRVAAGDPALWTAIFAQNSAAVRAALGTVLDRLGEFRTALDANDWTTLAQLLTQAKKVRDALGAGPLPDHD